MPIQPVFTKQKIDFGKYIDKDKRKEKRVKEKFAKVAHLILDAETHGIENGVKGVRIVADTPKRLANGCPSMEIINPDIEAALDDIATLGLTNAAS